MVNPSSSSSLRPCSSKKRKRKSKTETEVEESSKRLLRPCSTNESITAGIEEDKEKMKQNIDGDDDGACKMIRDGCDFLCAEELGKQFLLCGGRYHRYHSNTSTRNRNKKNHSVSIKKVLHKKSVGILFANLTSSDELYFLRPLKEVYYQLTQQRRAAFEIVFVPYFPRNMDDHSYEDERKDRFNAHLKQMPWLAVQFDDIKNWRKHLLKRYQQESSGYNNALMLFGPNGRPFQEHCSDGIEKLVQFFGPDFYPFTKAREKELIHKYFAPLRSSNKSLEGLLGGSGRDFLISSSGDGDYKKIPISQHQGKVVGIYFFFREEEKHQNRDFMRKLEDFRLRASSERGSSFEIVFINLDFEFGYSSETSFRRFLKKWPWLLALPFKDDKIRALCYTLAIGDSVNNLVIVGGGGGEGGDEFFIDPQGYSIIQEYGFDAYPFTRDMAIATAKKRLTQLKLADFFKATGTEFLSRCKGKPEKPVSFLQNKKVLLYIACSRSHREIKKLLDLQKKDKSFKVLFFAPEQRTTSTIKAMPKKWVAFPRGASFWKLTHKLINVNIEYNNYFIAFDDTGKLLNMGGMKLLKKDGAAAFPFITDETFDNEYRQMMIYDKKWGYEVEEWNYKD